MTEGSENPHLIQKITRLLGICLLIGVIVYFLTKDVERISISVQDDHLSLSYSAGDSIIVRYEDILSVTERQDVDLGRYVSGTETDKYRFGVWENEGVGNYSLYVYTDVAHYIAIETSNGMVIFNLESSDATDSFYEAFQEMLESK